ncbi:MAG: hypothetical protein U0R17_07485 [Acidimicrobiia bacterium]
MKIFTLSSFTWPPFLRSSDKNEKASSYIFNFRGLLPFSVCKVAIYIISALLLLLTITGCKANATLNIDLQNKASGKISFVLDLDEEATSFVKSESYNPQSLNKIFNTKKLKELGIKTSTIENKDGSSKVSFKASFNTENEFKNILLILAEDKFLSSKLKVSNSFIYSKQNFEIKFDKKSFKNHYLNDSDIKSSLTKSGVEYSEYEEIIKQVFDNTSVNIKVTTKDKTIKAASEPKDLKEIKISNDEKSLRTEYMLKILGAIICLFIALILIYKMCRTPKLLSNSTKFSNSRDAQDINE